MMQKLNKVFMCAFISLHFLVYSVSGERECRQVSGKPGLCVSLHRCNMVLELIRNLQKPLPKDVGLLLKDSFFCGSDKGGVGVCCPEANVARTTNTQIDKGSGQCKYQDGSAGTCLSYLECFPFLQLLQNLRKPLPIEVPLIMREVYLCGRDDGVPKICCPSESIISQHYQDMMNKATKVEARSTTTPTTSSTATSTQPDSKDNQLQKHEGLSRLSSLETCGRSMMLPRVVGGKDARLGQYPWIVNIGYTENGNNEVVFKCGGTLIGPRHVLTAAHCVAGLHDSMQLSSVRFGEHDLSSAPDCDINDNNFCASATQEYATENVIVHPDYNNPNRFNNDIAIIKINKEVKETDFISPICLPFPSVFTIDTVNREPEVAGWGAVDMYARRFSDVLQYVSVPFYGFSSCQDIYKRQKVQLVDSQLCAGGKKGEDSCSGDSGSGLMMDVEINERPYDPRWIQVGIVSFGPRRCATKGVPGVYTNVSSYLPWILDSVLL